LFSTTPTCPVNENKLSSTLHVEFAVRTHPIENGHIPLMMIIMMMMMAIMITMMIMIMITMMIMVMTIDGFDDNDNDDDDEFINICIIMYIDA
jgi:hypothetical protein